MCVFVSLTLSVFLSLVVIYLSIFFFFFFLGFSSSSYSKATPSTMVDLQAVCCMCGDVGFPDKLFRCNKCRNRIQHSYCSNYYSEFAEPIEMCDWCQSEERSSRHGSSSKKSSSGYGSGITNRSEYSGDKIKQQDREESGVVVAVADKGKNPGGAPSPRTTTRRYKLLKDVMC